MKVYHSLDDVKAITNAVITTGTFDGVHVGHQVIIRRLKKLAADIGGETVLVTFHPHPRRVLYPQTEGRDLMMICSQAEKIAFLEKTGLDHLVILPFTREFSKITSHSFVEDILIKKLNARIIVVGFNHHFGHHREGNYKYLYNLGRLYKFEVEEIPEQDIQNESVSSTRIRKAVTEGNIQRANAYLDHYYTISGTIQINHSASGLFDLAIFPCLPDDNTKLMPPDGVYAVSFFHGDQQVRGMLSVQHHAIVNSFISPATAIEFHPFRNPEGMDNSQVTLRFHKKIRDGFSSVNSADITTQLKKDIKTVEELIF
ncbi:MAG TPA: riboflavin kinase [Bacteroidales bacterium]|nr:riboflavin kinase [Bacteroidales bacterium]